MFSPKPYKYTTSGRRNQVFQPFFPTVFRLYTLTFSRTGLCFIKRQTSILIASSWQASYYCIRFIKKYRCTRAFDFSKQEKIDKQEIGFYFVLYSAGGWPQKYSPPSFCYKCELQCFAQGLRRTLLICRIPRAKLAHSIQNPYLCSRIK